MEFAPSAMDQALADGTADAEAVLAHVMRTALPRYRWPPDGDSPIRPQWDRLAPVLARALGLDPPPDRRYGNLRVFDGGSRPG